MNKILFILLITLASNSYAQESLSDMFKSKERRQTEAKAKAEKEKEELQLSLIPKVSNMPKSNIGKAGFCLEKSAKFQYAAIGCGIISSGMVLASILIDDKYEINKKTGEFAKKNSGVKTALVIGGSSSLIAAVVCEFISINYKLRSGQYLQLHSNGAGGSVALVF